MFERFSDHAKRVLAYAQDEARLLHHDFIETEHILVGLIREDEGLAAQVLQSLGISILAVRKKVEEPRERPGRSKNGPSPFTPRSKMVLDAALREALQLGHKYIEAEHLLLGITREGQGSAVDVLQSLGADVARVRATIVRLISNNQTKP